MEREYITKIDCQFELGLPEIVRCKDCRFAHMTYDGLCKQCDNATDDDDIKLTLYLPGDFYCAFGERKDGDGDG